MESIGFFPVKFQAAVHFKKMVMGAYLDRSVSCIGYYYSYRILAFVQSDLSYTGHDFSYFHLGSPPY